jgi:hypothetical protein
MPRAVSDNRTVTVQRLAQETGKMEPGRRTPALDPQTGIVIPFNSRREKRRKLRDRLG